LIKIGGKDRWQIRDGKELFVTGNEPAVRTIEQCIASGWTPLVRYCREGGRQVIIDVQVK
jgi:hypothetical protein